MSQRVCNVLATKAGPDREPGPSTTAMTLAPASPRRPSHAKLAPTRPSTIEQTPAFPPLDGRAEPASFADTGTPQTPVLPAQQLRTTGAHFCIEGSALGPSTRTHHGLRDGREPVSVETAWETVPLSMTMDMQMGHVMFAPSDRVTLVPDGVLAGHRVGIEFGGPLFESLDGPPDQSRLDVHDRTGVQPLRSDEAQKTVLRRSRLGTMMAIAAAGWAWGLINQRGRSGKPVRTAPSVSLRPLS